MMTHTPNWSGMTHQLTVLTDARDDIDSEHMKEAVAAGLRRLERQSPGKTYREVGRDICQRIDLEPRCPWQLFIGLEEIDA